MSLFQVLNIAYNDSITILFFTKNERQKAEIGN